MGREIHCQARHEGQVGQVKALLETDAVILRGEIKATIPFAGLRKVEARDGELTLDDTTLAIGEHAARWADKILHPPTLLDKLGIKPGMCVTLLDFHDASFMHGEPYDSNLEGGPYDVILFHASSEADLARLGEIAPKVGQKTMLWIVYPKGRREITEAQVFAHGKGIGLVDVKVCRFNDALTGLKFVRRKA